MCSARSRGLRVLLSYVFPDSSKGPHGRDWSVPPPACPFVPETDAAHPGTSGHVTGSGRRDGTVAACSCGPGDVALAGPGSAAFRDPPQQKGCTSPSPNSVQTQRRPDVQPERGSLVPVTRETQVLKCLYVPAMGGCPCGEDGGPWPEQSCDSCRKPGRLSGPRRSDPGPAAGKGRPLAKPRQAAEADRGRGAGPVSDGGGRPGRSCCPDPVPLLLPTLPLAPPSEAALGSGPNFVLPEIGARVPTSGTADCDLTWNEGLHRAN